ncbi:MAG: hypothetical protein OSA88_00295 [Acidimicrobiales bacterium]|nr:hypothetical protein [Acidimicrobiales bacterium]
MSITTEFHDPRADAQAVAEPYELEVDLGKPLTIGLVANGFPDSVRFLDHVEKSLGQVVPTASFVRYDKGDASSVVSGRMLEDIQAECQAVVAAYGH